MHRWLMSDRRFIASFSDSANMPQTGSTVLPIERLYPKKHIRFMHRFRAVEHQLFTQGGVVGRLP